MVLQSYPQMNHYDSRCPECRSVERHRLAYMLMKDRINKKVRLLHFAPEPSIKRWLETHVADYISADIDPKKAMEQVDITNIRFEDNTFDVVWCSHVLEHVDDTKALFEIKRILKPGGYAVLQVPIWGKQTKEDKTITDPSLRKELYFQFDHVRLYGIDIVDRFKYFGFDVEVLTDHDLTPETVYKHSLSFSMTNHVFICYK